MAVQEVPLTDNAALLPPSRRPTGRMVGYLLLLAGERVSPRHGTCGEERIETVHALVMERPLNRAQVGQMIDWYKVQPREPVESEASADDFDSDTLVQGVYELGGEVFVVQMNRARTHLYAKRAVEAPSDRLNLAGEPIKIRYEYAPGVVKRLRPEQQMSLGRAQEFLLRFGQCIRCGRHLEVKASVERSLGPVCVKYFRQSVAA